jgi:putative toxin-antitoxin system antitoxin component (TIGR02293 family)
MAKQVKKSKSLAHKTVSTKGTSGRTPMSVRIKRSGKIVSKIVVHGPHTYFLERGPFNRMDPLKKSDLTYTQIIPIIDFLDYKQKDIAQFLDVNESTISRWKSKDAEIGSLRTKTIIDIDEIIAKGVRIFGSEESFKDWLNTSNYALGDQKPIELLKNPYGVEMVEEAIDALSWGAYI